ncbi:hypothetical protein [Streptomyces sviceus]
MARPDRGPGGQAVTSGWNADYSPNSGQVTAATAPGSYTLNGTGCAVTGS